MFKQLMIASTVTVTLFFGWATAGVAGEPASHPNSPKVLEPVIKTIPAPVKATQVPYVDQSILLGRSPAYTPGKGKGDAKFPWYEPVEAGAYQIRNGARKLQRSILADCSQLLISDMPYFQLRPHHWGAALPQSYWPQKDLKNRAKPSLGTLRMGIVQKDGTTVWFDKLPNIIATFWPGYSDYEVPLPEGAGGGKAFVRAAPIPGSFSTVWRVRFEGTSHRLVWSFGGITYNREKPLLANQVKIDGNQVQITEPQELPNGLVLAGWDGTGSGRAIEDKDAGQIAEFTADQPQPSYHIYAHWGVTQLDLKPFNEMLDRLKKSNAATEWPQGLARLQKVWWKSFVEPVLEPQQKFAALAKGPSGMLDRAVAQWDARRASFVVNTPDKSFNAIMNWVRCISDYHKLGPGYVYAPFFMPHYNHLSTGWYGKECAGDHADNEMNLRLYALFQMKDDPSIKFRTVGMGGSSTPKGGAIGYTGDFRLKPGQQENSTPYFVDQIWRNYCWTGNKAFLRDMWPTVCRAIDWELTYEDPDGDGLFRCHYEYWNCDTGGGKGPKGASPTAICYGMLDAAAKIAQEIGETQAQQRYRALAEKSKVATQRELWNPEVGVMGTIGVDQIRRLHTAVWEQFLPVFHGLITPEQGRRAMTWVESHYGFTGYRPDVRLLMVNDWWPRWGSQHWVAMGDQLMSAMTGMKCGDPDLWWPYVKTVVQASYRNDRACICQGITNNGSAGTYPDMCDADDRYPLFTVYGLFGIESNLYKDELSICPAFPSDWKQASIKTPDVSYEYQREGNIATFHIRSARPLIKRVKANLTSQEIVTASEQESIVKIAVGPALPELTGPKPPAPIITDHTPVKTPEPLSQAQRERLIQVDLSKAYNTTPEDMTQKTKFLFDLSDEPDLKPINVWWNLPSLEISPMPREINTKEGVSYLTGGHGDSAQTRKNLLALASWKPYPFPGGVNIAIDRHCQRVYLLLASFTAPHKSYIPNGEVVLRYADGKTETTQLIPPFNLDCYYQAFSREGEFVPMGKLVCDRVHKVWFGNSDGIEPPENYAHALSLMLPCDPARKLESVELRATCSEAVIGLLGMTLLPAETSH